MRALSPRVTGPADLAVPLGARHATLWQWASGDPTLPRPIKTGPQVTAWQIAKLSEWLAEHDEATKRGSTRPSWDVGF